MMCTKGIKNRARISGSITYHNLKECTEILLSHWSCKENDKRKTLLLSSILFI